MRDGEVHKLHICPNGPYERIIRNGTPVTTVAEMVGYAAYSSFYRQHVEFFGITPEKEKQTIRFGGV